MSLRKSAIGQRNKKRQTKRKKYDSLIISRSDARGILPCKCILIKLHLLIIAVNSSLIDQQNNIPLSEKVYKAISVTLRHLSCKSLVKFIKLRDLPYA